MNRIEKLLFSKRSPLRRALVDETSREERLKLLPDIAREMRKAGLISRDFELEAAGYARRTMGKATSAALEQALAETPLGISNRSEQQPANAVLFDLALDSMLLIIADILGDEKQADARALSIAESARDLTANLEVINSYSPKEIIPVIGGLAEALLYPSFGRGRRLLKAARALSTDLPAPTSDPGESDAQTYASFEAEHRDEFDNPKNEKVRKHVEKQARKKTADSKLPGVNFVIPALLFVFGLAGVPSLLKDYISTSFDLHEVFAGTQFWLRTPLAAAEVFNGLSLDLSRFVAWEFPAKPLPVIGSNSATLASYLGFGVLAAVSCSAIIYYYVANAYSLLTSVTGALFNSVIAGANFGDPKKNVDRIIDKTVVLQKESDRLILHPHFVKALLILSVFLSAAVIFQTRNFIALSSAFSENWVTTIIGLSLIIIMWVLVFLPTIFIVARFLFFFFIVSIFWGFLFFILLFGLLIRHLSQWTVRILQAVGGFRYRRDKHNNDAPVARVRHTIGTSMLGAMVIGPLLLSPVVAAFFPPLHTAGNARLPSEVILSLGDCGAGYAEWDQSGRYLRAGADVSAGPARIRLRPADLPAQTLTVASADGVLVAEAGSTADWGLVKRGSGVPVKPVETVREVQLSPGDAEAADELVLEPAYINVKLCVRDGVELPTGLASLAAASLASEGAN